MDREPCVLVIGRTDHDRIDVAIGQELAVIRIPGYAVVRLPRLLPVGLVDQLFASFDPFAIEIADGNDAGHVVLPDARQIVPSRDAADADGADVDALARRRRAEDG